MNPAMFVARLVVLTSLAFGFAAFSDARKRRVRRAEWARQRAREQARVTSRSGPSWRYMTASGHFFALERVPLRLIRERIEQEPCMGLPVCCAQDEAGQWLLWPAPYVAGEVVQVLGAIPRALETWENDPWSRANATPRELH